MKKRRLSLAANVNLLIIAITLGVSLVMMAINAFTYRRAILDPYTWKLRTLEVQTVEFAPCMDYLMQYMGTEELRQAVASIDPESSNGNTAFIEWMEAQPSFTAYDPEYGRSNLFLDWISLELSLEELMEKIDLDESCIEVMKDGTVYRLAHEQKPDRFTPDVEFGLEEAYLPMPPSELASPTLVNLDGEYLLTRCVAFPLEGGEGHIWLAFDMTEAITDHRGFLLRSIFYVVGLTLAASLVSIHLLRRFVTNPIRSLARAATEFEPGEDGTYSADKISRVELRSDNELGDLSREIRSMQTRIVENTDRLTRMTAEKERIHTELDMATRIQEGMLPNSFPPYPNRMEFDLFASMTPAKEVGGDFYDFFLIDDDHLALVMADVSGKGVPGALFMMVSKTILKNSAMAGKSAAEILSMTNELICSNNKMQMFVTVWLGILEISTGVITAANAGHEYPALMKNGRFELYRDKHGFVIGGLEGMRYREYTMQLEKGDKLFLYTDGVPEATDANGELFGTDRMIDALNACAAKSPKGILIDVKRAVDAFVGSAEQFDDLTMLCIEYRG